MIRDFSSQYWMIPELRRLPKPRQKELFAAGYRAYLRSWGLYATGAVCLAVLIIGKYFWNWVGVGNWDGFDNWVADAFFVLTLNLLQCFFVNREIRRMIAVGR